MEENIADALKIAGSVLLFVIALSICILMFTQARESVDLILSYTDRESISIEKDPRFYYISNVNDTHRYVGLETIIPTIYEVYGESHDVVFDFQGDTSYYIFKTINGTTRNELTPVNKETSIGYKNEEIIEYLNGILFGKYKTSKQAFIQDFRCEPNEKPLITYLDEKLRGPYKIKEDVGIYYYEDQSDATVNSKPTHDKAERTRVTYTIESIT